MISAVVAAHRLASARTADTIQVELHAPQEEIAGVAAVFEAAEAQEIMSPELGFDLGATG